MIDNCHSNSQQNASTGELSQYFFPLFRLGRNFTIMLYRARNMFNIECGCFNLMIVTRLWTIYINIHYKSSTQLMIWVCIQWPTVNCCFWRCAMCNDFIPVLFPTYYWKKIFNWKVSPAQIRNTNNLQISMCRTE